MQAADALRLRRFVLAQWGAQGFRRALRRRRTRLLEERIRASQGRAILEAWRVHAADARRRTAALQDASARCATIMRYRPWCCTIAATLAKCISSLMAGHG